MLKPKYPKYKFVKPEDNWERFDFIEIKDGKCKVKVKKENGEEVIREIDFSPELEDEIFCPRVIKKKKLSQKLKEFFKKLFGGKIEKG